MIVYQLVVNNTLLSRVYTKPLIVFFGIVVCTLSVVRGTHAAIVECSFFLSFEGKKIVWSLQG